MYPPHCQCPENVKLTDSVNYANNGWTVDPSHYRLFEAEKAKQEKQQSRKKTTTQKIERTRTTKSNPTSTTKKTVTKTTNKKGETVIKVNKTITLKKK